MNNTNKDDKQGIVVYTEHPDYEYITKNHGTYISRNHPWFHRIYVDSETLCFLKLKYKLFPWESDETGIPFFLVQ